MKSHASMNRIYRLVWNQVLNAWVAVAETARGRGKGASRKLVAAALSLTAALAQAAPDGGQVVSGAGSIAQSGTSTTIQQSSQNLSLNWKSFNIAPQETVNFVQPSASAIAVNRIFDTGGTQILGRLNANGQVYLINPNGILFGQGAQVNVGGLVASTLDLNDASLNGNERSFSGNGTGGIVNRGTINAADGGYVALLGNTVSNQGTISARLGAVALGAGSAATLTFNGNSLVKMQVDQSVLASLAENGGLINADGGMVLMNAGAKNELLASVVNNTGIIEARTVENHEGTIILLGGMTAGTVNVGGTLDASAPTGGNGGFIETSAAHVKVADEAKITTAAPNGNSGTWLIDPYDFTIAASGGDITGATLGAALGAGAVVIQTLADSISCAGATCGTGNASGSGEIFVNDAVTWSANKLTLAAHNSININANLNASGTASLALEYGQGAVALNNTSNIITVNGAAVNLPAGTANFTTRRGSDGVVKNYTVITSLGAEGSTTATDLQGMNGNRAANYALGSDIDATATSTWNAGAGFAPIGDEYVTRFTGTFDGLGHTISTLTINRSTTYVGLFGYSYTAIIQNVGLVGGSVSSIGSGIGGGLMGYGYSSTVNNSYATASVVGGAGSSIGGLIGTNVFGTVSNSYATGSVSGTGYVGGLVGSSPGGSISNSYATGSVSGTEGNVGGLVGYSSGTANNNYATGNVSGIYYVGGLVGYNDGGTANNSYATGNVSGIYYVGGLVGLNFSTVGNSYATGSVSGSSAVGGLVGLNLGSVSNSYWDTQTSGRSTGIGDGTLTGVTGRTSAEMMSMASFTGFDIANAGGSRAVWRIYEGQTTPWLMWWLKPLTATANSDTRTYSGAPYSGGNGVTYSVASPSPAPSGVLAYGGTAQSAANAGSYTISASGLYSVQQGYDISYVAGALTINQADLTLSGTRVYNSTTVFAGSNLTATGVNSETFAVGGVGDSSNLSTKNVQTNQTLASVTGLTLGSSGNGGVAGNYNSLAMTGSSVSVTAKAITASGITANNKVYNANDVAILNTGAAALSSGAAADDDNKYYTGDTAALNVAGANGVFNTTSFVQGKDVGTAKAVSVSGLALTAGGDSDNYTLTDASGAAADITAKAITASGITASNKVYNANAVAILNTGSAAITGGATTDVDNKFYTSDAVTLDATSATGTFILGKDVGTNKAVTVSGLALGNNTAGNYTLTAPSGAAADITAKAITASGITASNKVYNANDVAILNTGAATLTGGAVTDVDNKFYTSDAVTLDATSATGAFTLGKDVGTNKAVTVSGLTLGNNAAGNYTLTAPSGAAADITKAHLTVTADDKTRLYGAANPALTSTVSGLVNGESATNAAGFTGAGSATTAANATTSVGTALITAGAGSLAATNYDFTAANGTLTIDKAHLTVTADHNSRVYGAANPILTTSVSGFVNDEDAGTAAGFGGAASATTTAGLTTNVGTAVITAGANTLVATNYDFITLVDGVLTINPAALVLNSGAPPQAPEPVHIATSQIQAEFTLFNPIDQHQTLLLSPTIGGEANSYLKEVVVVGNKETRINIGGLGPILEIVNGGMRLPGNLDNENE